MKYVFYALVLINLGFFLWKTSAKKSGEEEGSLKELLIPSGGAPIQLLREVPLLATTKPKEKGGGDDTAKISSKSRKGKANCFLLGPRQSQTDAEGLRDLLTTHTADTTVITRLGDVADGWWLLYPRALTQETARENRRMLSAKGIHDTWIFDNGPLQWGISLGLFNDLVKAEATQKTLAEKDIMIEVMPRMVRGNVYWVKVPWRRPPLELEEVVQVLNMQDPSLKIPGPVPCD